MFSMMVGCSGDKNTTASATASDTYAGILTDASTGAPIVGARLTNGVTTVVTNADGAFDLGFIESGAGNGNGTQVIIDLTKVTSPVATYPATVIRNVAGLNAGGGVVSVGQATATVTGFVTLPTTGFPAVGANVFITNNFGGFAAAAPVKTDATGAYTFTKLEAGATFTITASSADGLSSGTATLKAPVTGSAATQAPPIAMTFNAVNPTFNAVGTTITVGTNVSQIAAFGVNAGDFAAGATTITFKLSKPVVASDYTGAFGTAAPVNSPLWNDVTVNVAAKAGNVTNYSVTFTDSQTLTVGLTTVASSVYTVDITKVLAKIFDARGIVFTAAPAPIVTFGTVGAAAITTAPTVTLVGKSAAGDLQLTIQPIVNVVATKGFHIYVQKVINGVAGDFILGTTLFPAAGGVFDLNGTAFNGAAAYFSPVLGDPKTAFYSGITPITYNVKVAPVNLDNLEGAATTVAVIDTTPPTITAKVSTTPFAPATTTATTVAIGTATVLTGSFQNGLVTPTATAVYKVTFDEQMQKAAVETLANWGTTGTYNAAAPAVTLGPISAVVGTNTGTLALGTTAGAVLTVAKVAYSQIAPFVATISVTATYSLSSTVTDPAGTTYTLSAPTFDGSFLFTNTQLLDLKGNAFVYDLPVLAPADLRPKLGF
jgi:hypothetical protein